jgi:adenylate kinase
MSFRLILLGKQGAGKGTQAARLSEHYKIPHASTGDLFRAAVGSGTELGYRVKSILDSGHLVSDELTNEIVRERLQQPDVAEGFLLDGYPRTQSQVNALTEMLAPNEIDLVINLDIPDELAIARLSSRRVCRKNGHIYGADHLPKNPLICDICGSELIQRDDDKPDAIRKRLDLYEDQTAPILKHYGDLGKLVTVDGSGTVDEVFNKITSVIEDSLSATR